ncbi:hypothetical protein C8R44DRAFT_811748 [Mycena epipterygia]|nr:hypothetical protein C8R44DRAFT_811748 [Mycena epipterygia]
MSHSLTCTAHQPLSLRSGLAVIVTIGLLSGSALGITGWVAANKLNAQFSDTERLALSLHVLVYLLLVIFSAVGLYSTLFKRRKAVQVFVSMLFVQLLFGLGSGIFLLYLLFQKQSSETIQNCLTNVHGSFGKQLCERSPVLRGVALLVVICFVEILGLILGNAYSSQLREAETEEKMNNPDDEAYWEA